MLEKLRNSVFIAGKWKIIYLAGNEELLFFDGKRLDTEITQKFDVIYRLNNL